MKKRYKVPGMTVVRKITVDPGDGKAIIVSVGPMGPNNPIIIYAVNIIEKIQARGH